MNRLVLIMALLIASIAKSSAQSVGPAALNACGGTAVIGAAEFDWSVGEMTMVSTFSTSAITVTQGLLQPADVTEGVSNTSLLAKQLQVFPNPATSEVNLRYSSERAGTLVYTLMDVTGRVIRTKAVDYKAGTTLEQITVATLADATYMLEVTVNPIDSSPEKISYKIQKL